MLSSVCLKLEAHTMPSSLPLNFHIFKRANVDFQVPAMADDYACLTKGLLDLFEATGHTPHLAWAKRLQVRVALPQRA